MFWIGQTTRYMETIMLLLTSWGFAMRNWVGQCLLTYFQFLYTQCKLTIYFWMVSLVPLLWRFTLTTNWLSNVFLWYALAFVWNKVTKLIICHQIFHNFVTYCGNWRCWICYSNTNYYHSAKQWTFPSHLVHQPLHQISQVHRQCLRCCNQWPT